MDPDDLAILVINIPQSLIKTSLSIKKSKVIKFEAITKNRLIIKIYKMFERFNLLLLNLLMQDLLYPSKKGAFKNKSTEVNKIKYLKLEFEETNGKIKGDIFKSTLVKTFLISSKLSTISIKKTAKAQNISSDFKKLLILNFTSFNI